MGATVAKPGVETCQVRVGGDASIVDDVAASRRFLARRLRPARGEANPAGMRNTVSNTPAPRDPNASEDDQWPR
jgi:hypothetical protein